MSFEDSYYGSRRETSGLAIASLVLGVCGFFALPLIGSIAAIVCGNLAYSEIDRSGGRLGGSEWAKAGLILGWIGLAVDVLVIIAIVLLVWWASGVGSNTSFYIG